MHLLVEEVEATGIFELADGARGLGAPPRSGIAVDDRNVRGRGSARRRGQSVTNGLTYFVLTNPPAGLVKSRTALAGGRTSLVGVRIVAKDR